MGNKLYVKEPISVGLILSYKCTSECKHCMYCCSPRWDADWISGDGIEKILVQLVGRVKGSPLGSDKIGINYGLHFTGGEPFLNFRLLLEAVEFANELKIPSTFVETNSF
ncbi:MAG: 4Fe-4S cluster-binding domain-containing protein [Candidatus Bathyarchaeia archaeon]